MLNKMNLMAFIFLCNCMVEDREDSTVTTPLVASAKAGDILDLPVPTPTCFNVDDKPNQICISSLEFIRYNNFVFSGSFSSSSTSFLKIDANLSEFFQIEPDRIYDFEASFGCSSLDSWRVIVKIDGRTTERITTNAYGPCLADTPLMLDIISKYDFGESVMFDSLKLRVF